MKVYIAIDTCVWINIARNIFDTELIDKITDLVRKNEISLLIPEIIKEEWDKHKIDKITDENIISAKGKLKNIRELKDYLDDADFVVEFLSNEKTILDSVGNKSKSVIKKVDDLFCNSTTRIIKCNQEVKNKVIENGLLKRAPQHQKSSVADAVIVHSLMNYVSKHNLSPTIFVTDNKSDFSSSKKKSNVHEDLANDFEKFNISYFTNIGMALNSISAGLISKAAIDKIESVHQERYCLKCGSQMDYGSFKPSAYGGWTWQYTCGECGFRFDTGEYMD